MGFKVETGLYSAKLEEIAKTAKYAEETGYDGLHTSETANDPFLPLALAAEHTERIMLSTAVAIAFPRSPMITAMMSWDLQRYSKGRFMLGLGTQVKGHNERRFSVPWSAPAPRLKEYVETLRAIWDTFQNNTKPSYQGQHYQFTLMNPTFNPGPIEHPDIPVHLAAVNEGNARVAGEVADGIKLHAFNTMSYAKEVLMPAIEEGLKKRGKTRDQFQVWGGGFLATGKDEAAVERAIQEVKRMISFYGSTRTYQNVLEHHGWQEVGEKLHEMSVQGKWKEMPNLITDEMVNEFAVVATWDNVVEKMRERYGGLVDCIDFSDYARSVEDQDVIKQLVKDLQKDVAVAPA
jgi:probable F420-dependent oxidoreductase